MKRLLSMLLALAISCSYLSLAALAAEGEDETPKATITYSVAEGGTLTINGTPHNAAEAVTTGPDGLPLPHTVTLPEGVDVAFSALPDASHTLAALTVTGLPVGTPAPVITNGMGTVKAVNGLQIHASFDILTYTVDVRQAPGGTISASGLGANGTTAANGSVTLAAAANDNYEFSHFLVDGAQVTANPCTFTVTKDTVVSALFTANPVTHSVTVDPPVGGRIQVSGIDDAGLVADGAKITIAAEPDGSHTFGALLINGTDVGSATHGMEVHGDVTVSATFPEKAPETYSVSVTAGAGGSAAASDETGAPLSGPVTAGTRVTLTAQADETHTFSHFLIGGVQIAKTPYTLTVNGAVSAEAVFAEKPAPNPSESSKPDNGGEGSNGIPTVQVSVNQPAAGGKVTQVAANGATLASGAFPGALTLKEGDTLTITAAPGEKYQLKSVSVNGGAAAVSGNTASYTVQADDLKGIVIESAYTASAPVAVDSSAATGASVAVGRGGAPLQNTDAVTEGDALTFTVTPADAGKAVQSVTVNGKAAAKSGDNAFGYAVTAEDILSGVLKVEAVLVSTDVQVKWNPAPETGVTVEVKPENGTADKSGDLTVPHNASLIVGVSAPDGKSVEKVTVAQEGGSAPADYVSGADGSFKIPFVRAAVTAITPTVNEVRPRISWTAPPAGSITVKSGDAISTGGDVPYDSTITIEVTPPAGRLLEKVAVTGNGETAPKDYTSKVGENKVTVEHVKADITALSVAYQDDPGNPAVTWTAPASGKGTITVTAKEGGGAVTNGSTVALGSTVTIKADPPAGYFLKSLAVAGGAAAGTTAYSQFSSNGVEVKMDYPVTAITPVFAQYRKVTLADIQNATVTARGAFYPNSDGTGSTFTTLSEKGAGYVYAELGKDPTVTLSVRDMSLGSQLQVKNNGNGIGSPLRSGDSLAISVNGDLALSGTVSAVPLSPSGAGRVHAPIAVQDEEGAALEDKDGDAFNIRAISSEGRLVLDGVTPGQTFYIKLGENGYDLPTTLDSRLSPAPVALASQLADDDLFRLSIDRDGDGKSLISSITQVDEKRLKEDGVRGSYLKVVLKDSTATEEKKARATITFKARKTLDASKGGPWQAGDTATLDLTMWIENTKKSGSDEDADVGDRIYIDPESNEYNTFVWGDDRAALEYHADDNAKAFYARLSTKADIDIYTDYGDPVDADLWFYNFIGNPEIPSTSRAWLTLGIPWDEDSDYHPDPRDVYIYQVDKYGDLEDVTDRFTYSDDAYAIEGWTIRTRQLGTYIISDTELDLDTGYEMEYDWDDDAYEEQYKVNPVTGGGTQDYTPVTLPVNYGGGSIGGSTGGAVSEPEPEESKPDDQEEEGNRQVTAKPVPEAVPEVDEPEEKPAGKGFAPWAVVLVIALIAAGAGTGGYFLYRHFSE